MDPLFPYTTLFRSLGTGHEGDRGRTPLRSSWAAIRHPRRDTTSVGEQQGGPHIRQYVSAKFRHLIDVRTERHPSFRTSCLNQGERSEEHTSELQSLMRISYAVFCLQKKKSTN